MGRLSPSQRRRRAIVLSLVGALALVLVVVAPASADFLWPEGGGSPNADRIQDLYKIVGVVAILVFVGVEGALIYALVKFRARKGAVAAQIRGNTRLEIAWTLGAALILVFLAIVTFTKLGAIDNPPNSKIATGTQLADATRRLPPNGQSVNICVNGQQYIWRFTYESKCSDTTSQNTQPFSYEEMVVPTGVTVTLDIVSQDVAHSWWIPQLGGKFDAIPAYTNHTWFQIPEKLNGHVFTGQCAELCGRNHADMTARVRAISFADWKVWLAGQKKNILAADAAAAAFRTKIQDQAKKGQNNAASGTVTLSPTRKNPLSSTAKPPKTATLSPLAMQGKTVFTGAGGCGGCHTLADAGTTGAVGPNLGVVLKGKYGTAAFIKTSIVNPNAFIAPGYGKGIMPAGFAQSLGPAKINALVAYLSAVNK